MDGVMRDPPAAPCAAVPGTIVTVEDLFYNVLTRKRALRNASEEYARVLDVVDARRPAFAAEARWHVVRVRT